MKIKNAVKCLCLVLSALSSQHALAYGYAKDVVPEKARGYLVDAVAKNRKINFCLNIEKSAANGISAQSINSQTNMAIRAWLHAVPELNNTKIDVVLVTCDSPSLNLEVYIGPDPGTIDPEREHIVTNRDRSFSLIKINTLYSQPYKGQHLELHDFAEIAQRVKHSDSIHLSDLIDVMVTTYKEKQNAWDIAAISGVDPIQVKASTYFLLLHAVGHSFGLCDTDIGDGAPRNCDENTVVRAADGSPPVSVMDVSKGLFYLTSDDIDGITSLFSRYGGY
jgi:hypothetical protein